jgi:large subunit ribosomal protein L24
MKPAKAGIQNEKEMKTVKTGTVRSRVKRGDQVVFIAGKEYNRYDSAGKRQPFRGKVIAVDARNGKVKVEGAMIVKRHRKPVPQMNREGGIFEQEAWVNISNVALIDPETGKPTRVKYEVRDGVKVRVAKSGKVLPETASYKKEPKKIDADEAPAQ